MAKSRYEDTIARATAFIDENLGSAIGIDDVAGAAGRSRRWLTRVFREITDETVLGRIGRLRMERAKTLLLETRMSIMEVSAACGFKDAAYFSAAFRRRTGVSPKAFRSRSPRRTPLTPTPPSGSGRVWLEEGFKRRTIDPRWRVISGTWEQGNGVLTGRGEGQL